MGSVGPWLLAPLRIRAGEEMGEEDSCPEPLLPVSHRTEVTLTLPCPLSAEALEVGKGLAVSAGEAGFEFVSDSEISAWLQTELRGRERKCIPLEDLVKCLG